MSWKSSEIDKMREFNELSSIEKKSKLIQWSTVKYLKKTWTDYRRFDVVLKCWNMKNTVVNTHQFYLKKIGRRLAQSTAVKYKIKWISINF